MLSNPKLCMAAVTQAQRHWRYSKGCKRSTYHARMQQELQQQAVRLHEQAMRERRVVQQGWLPYKD